MGQRWIKLCMKAEGFQSINNTLRVRMCGTVQQHMNNKSPLWGLMDVHAFYVLCVEKAILVTSTSDSTKRHGRAESVHAGLELCLPLSLSTVVYRETSSINCSFMQPWNQRTSTTRNWEGNIQQGFENTCKASVSARPPFELFMWQSVERFIRALDFIMIIQCTCCRRCCSLRFSVVDVLPCAY